LGFVQLPGECPGMLLVFAAYLDASATSVCSV